MRGGTISRRACLATRLGTDTRFEFSRCDWQQDSNPSYEARIHFFFYGTPTVKSSGISLKKSSCSAENRFS